MINKTQIAGIAYLGFVSGVTACANPSEETNTKPPNILFIMSDDHTSQMWGEVYGGVLKPYVQTKNIERLAKEGAVLQNCFCSNSLSTPSRGTILTGQYSHVNGIKTLGGKLDPNYNHIVKEMGKAGYQSAIIGKWHLNAKPSGFDYYNILHGQGEYHNPIFMSEENWRDGKDSGETYEGYCTDITTDMTIDWISKRDTDRPFIAMCHFKATHEPFDYPSRLENLYKDVTFPLPKGFNDSIPEKSGRPFFGQQIDELTQRYIFATNNPDKRRDYLNYPGLPFESEGLTREELRFKTYQKMIHDYVRCAAASDENIGRLLDYLDKAGLAENTIVIYTSDQGYFLGEHGFYDKRLIYEESLRMPLVIRYPKEIPAGSRNYDLIENVDFSALFADYSGIEYPAEMQGRSFRQNLKGNTPDNWRNCTYYRYWEHMPTIPGHFGIRTDRYKLTFYYGNGIEEEKEIKKGITPQKRIYWELLDLKADPTESRNLYTDSSYATVISELKEQLKAKRAEIQDTDADNPAILQIIAKHWDN
ncbi:MAG: sulfatase [Bacteroidales bacterium]